MHRGYIKLYRRLLESEIWTKEPFTRGQAWVDMIGLANHKEGFIRKRGIRVDLKRGEVGWGERELAQRWKWSRGKVRRFLNELCSESEEKLIPQTEPQNRNITSRYLIVNYDLYQNNDTTEKTADSTTNGPQTDRKRYQNKNEKNEKNNNGASLPEWLNPEIWKKFLEHRKKLRKPMTDYAQELMWKKLGWLKDKGFNPEHLLKDSMVKGYQDVFEPKN